MIYRNSYFSKEARHAYIDSSVGFRRKMLLALFMGLVSFAIYFVLQTLTGTVLSEEAPEIMQPSFFSTIYIYNHVALLSIMLYFIVYHDYLFFSEIRRNAWYLLIKMGYRPVVMISGKLLALLYSVIMIYSIGFGFIILLTVFLKYTFVFAYMPALYVTGLFDIILLMSLSAAVSLFVRKYEDARLLIFLSAVLVIVLKSVSGLYEILRNRVEMQYFANLFNTGQSWYYPAFAAIFIVCITGTILRARRTAKYYNTYERDEDIVPQDVTVVHIDSSTGKQTKGRKNSLSYKYKRLINAAVTVLLIFFIAGALAFNILIIMLSTATPGNEVTIQGTIPYVFRSDTMQPSIINNDLVFFRKVDTQYNLEEGQIVLFKENNIVYIERIVHIEGDTLDVDIDSYPPAATNGAMAKEISRGAVYGVYSGRSRWLGALILFSNTIIGRILFLLVPAVLLFYRKRIAALYREKRESRK